MERSTPKTVAQAATVCRVVTTLAIAADKLWHAEIVRVFGEKKACNVRYTDASKGEPGSELRRLHEAFRRGSAALNAAHVEYRRLAALARETSMEPA